MSDEYQKRTDSTQLPTAAEILDILRKESPRKAVRYDFIQKNDAMFDAHRRLSKQAGVDDSWITTYKDLSLEVLGAQIIKTHNTLMRYIQTHDDHELYVEFYNALVPSDDTSPSECLFVFGAQSNARIERAIELYNDGVAGKIIISGNSPHYLEGGQSEARRMADFAIEKGIPESALFLEEESITVPDNAKRSIDMLEKIGWQPSSITLIATNMVLTRAKMEWYTFCPWNLEIKTVAAHPQSEALTAEGWFKDEAAIKLVLNEYAKHIFESKVALMQRDSELL